MKQFRQFLTEEISIEIKKLTEFLVDTIYSHYIDEHNRSSVACVGWLDGSENALIRFQKIYEAGIGDKDSILDVGCGVAHLYTYLGNQGWKGKYLGFDPNKKAIDLIHEDNEKTGHKINAMEGTIEDLGDLAEWNRFDWVIANGIFNLGLKEDHSFWIIEHMISHANKGIIFNMLQAPYIDPKYEAYYPERIKEKLSKFDHRKIEIIEDYMNNDAEFTIYFYKT